jgi:hypothetical protein
MILSLEICHPWGNVRDDYINKSPHRQTMEMLRREDQPGSIMKGNKGEENSDVAT